MDKLKGRKIVHKKSIKDRVKELYELIIDIETPAEKKIVQKMRQMFLPRKEIFFKNIINIDIKFNFSDYIVPLITMVKYIERLNKIEKKLFDKSIEHKLFNAVPQRNDCIPKNITIDSFVLTSLFSDILIEHENDITENNGKPMVDRSNKMIREVIARNQDFYWNPIFDLNWKTFKRSNCHFNYLIETDGVAASIYFRHNMKIPKKNRPVEKKLFDINVDKISKVNKKKFIDKCIYLDPGMNDLFNATAIVGNNEAKMVYTSQERDMYTRINKYKEIRDQMKEQLPALYNKKLDISTFNRYGKSKRHRKKKGNWSANKLYKIKLSKRKQNKEFIDRFGKNVSLVSKLETKLSKYNSKTCSFDSYSDFIVMKNYCNKTLLKHYAIPLYRKLKLNVFINRRRNEDLMLDKFEATFNPNKEKERKQLNIIIGDWSKQTLRGRKKSILIGLRKLFLRRKHNVYLIKEHNTSKLCNVCHNEMEQAIINNKESWKMKICNSCHSVRDRDVNASRNMRHITEEFFSTGKWCCDFNTEYPKYNKCPYIEA